MINNFFFWDLLNIKIDFSAKHKFVLKWFNSIVKENENVFWNETAPTKLFELLSQQLDIKQLITWNKEPEFSFI